MDWIRLGNSGVDLSGTGGVPQRVTREQLANHKSKDNAWICLRGKQVEQFLIYLSCFIVDRF